MRHLFKAEPIDISKKFGNEPSASLTSSKNALLKWAEKIMIAVGISGQTLFYFQAYKIYSMASANDVSGWGFTFAFLSLVCWLIYGIIIKNKVLIIVNTFATIGAFLTLLAIVLVS
jgi:MtN3 and saliva related transmembrane protein